MTQSVFNYPLLAIGFAGHVRDAIAQHPSTCFAMNGRNEQKGAFTVALIRANVRHWNDETRDIIASDFEAYGPVLYVHYLPEGAEVNHIQFNEN